MQPLAGARAAQGPVQPPRAIQPIEPLHPAGHQRMLQQSQQRHRRKVVRCGCRQCQQQHTRRRGRQRHTGGVIGVDLPAFEMRRDTAGQRAVRRHQRHGAGAVQRRTDGERDGLRLIRRGRHFNGLHAGQATVGGG